MKTKDDKKKYEEKAEAEKTMAPDLNLELQLANDKYLRALADYQNLLRQTEKEKAAFCQFALADFLHDLLPVYDHLKLSLASLDEQEKSSPWVIGVGHVLKQFKEILSAKGVEEIKAVGEKFDPELMEAISGTGEIVEKEVRPGYLLHGQVLYPAKVIVRDNN